MGNFVRPLAAERTITIRVAVRSALPSRKYQYHIRNELATRIVELSCVDCQHARKSFPQHTRLRATPCHPATRLQLYFTTLSLVLLGVKLKSDKRATFLMSGSPAIKFGFWILFNALPFFLPNSVVLSYGYLARVGSALFLVIQLFLLLDFVLTMNEKWVAAAEGDDRHYKGMLALTVGCYAGCLILVGAPPFDLNRSDASCAAPPASCARSVRAAPRLRHESVLSCAMHTAPSATAHFRLTRAARAALLFHWFKPAGAGSCSLNVGIITATILLFVGFTVVSISPLVPSGSLFSSAVISSTPSTSRTGRCRASRTASSATASA